MYTYIYIFSLDIYWRREWQPTLVFLLGEYYGQRSLVGYSPWGCKESDTTEGLTLSFTIYMHYVYMCIHTYTVHIYILFHILFHYIYTHIHICVCMYNWITLYVKHCESTILQLKKEFLVNYNFSSFYVSSSYHAYGDKNFCPFMLKIQWKDTKSKNWTPRHI